MIAVVFIVLCVSIAINPIVGFIAGLVLYPIYRRCKSVEGTD
jgi:xanthine/uracil/vitamin C permease (AzgA family)